MEKNIGNFWKKTEKNNNFEKLKKLSKKVEKSIKISYFSENVNKSKIFGGGVKLIIILNY